MLPMLLLATMAATCESLAMLALPDTTIVSAVLVTEGPFTPPTAATPAPTGGPPARPLRVPAACRVVGRVQPAINFEVWMPVSNWNGKFQAVGGGGFAGVISYGAIATALNRGYATASTDTGHSTPGGSWALGHPELVIDFGYRAIHEMTVKAKAIIASFYGNGPRYSYFVGCSTGGRQGLMEAQRFPNDYDGIVAGAPANYWTRMPAGNLFTAAATLKDDATRLPAPKLAALNKAAIAACDARDGVTDGLIENPRECRFDPGALQCSSDETDACLTAAQVGAARKLYTSAVNPRTQEEIFPGMVPGSETTWGALETDDFVRLFMAPGMLHCAGGPGPNTFDAVTALEQWVEQRKKPAQLVASHSTNGTVDRTRPLCPYPQVAAYTGSGSIDEAASFVCK